MTIFMAFYPVYKICCMSGAFSRIGSLLGSRGHYSLRSSVTEREQARALFTQRPGDVILLGPRMDVESREIGKSGVGAS